MKKIFAMLGIGLIWCFLPMLVKAESQPNDNGNGYAYVTSGLNYGSPSGGGNTATVYSNYKLCVCKEYLTSGDNYHVLTADLMNDSEPHVCYIDSVANSKNIRLIAIDGYNAGTNIYISGYMNQNANFPWNWSFQMTPSLASSQTVVPLFDTLQEAESYILSPNIDFDNVYYSPLIATPILNPYYTSYNESGINIPYVPLTFDLSNSSEDYYLQIKQKNYTPSVVRVEGANKFNVQARNGFEVHDIYEMSDLIVSTDFSRNDFYDDISDNWTDDLNEFAFSNVEMINGLQSTIGSTADAYFLAQSNKFQQLRNIQTVYGNIVEIWARYFMIDENNKVVVGKWYHWWSLASDSFDEQLPEYIIPYEKAYGTENTTDQNNAPSGVGTINGTGTSSNPNQNYTYVSVVPNYPDYPTIASYNKDNLLVDTITKMNDTKVFFGEFNNFLQASFVWVPSWIWGIIGIGFALSIIVFFLRML